MEWGNKKPTYTLHTNDSRINDFSKPPQPKDVRLKTLKILQNILTSEFSLCTLSNSMTEALLPPSFSKARYAGPKELGPP